MKRFLPPLTRNTLIILSIIAAAAAALLGLASWRAGVAAAAYPQALKAHHQAVTARDDKLSEDTKAEYDVFMAQYRQAAGPREKAQLEQAFWPGYLERLNPILKDARDRQPRVAFVPFGAQLNGEYAAAVKLQDDIRRDYESVYAYAEAAKAHFEKAVEFDRAAEKATAIGNTIGRYEIVLLSAYVAGNYSDETRQKIAESIKNTEKLVGDFTRAVEAVPSSELVKSDKELVFTAANNYNQKKRELSRLYAGGDMKRFADAYEFKTDKSDRKNYQDFLSAYNDFLKKQAGLYDEMTGRYQKLTDRIKSL